LNLKDQEDFDRFNYKLTHLKSALDIHNEELSSNIILNYKLLESIYT